MSECESVGDPSDVFCEFPLLHHSGVCYRCPSPCDSELTRSSVTLQRSEEQGVLFSLRLCIRWKSILMMQTKISKISKGMVLTVDRHSTVDAALFQNSVASLSSRCYCNTPTMTGVWPPIFITDYKADSPTDEC